MTRDYIIFSIIFHAGNLFPELSHGLNPWQVSLKAQVSQLMQFRQFFIQKRKTTLEEKKSVRILCLPHHTFFEFSGIWAKFCHWTTVFCTTANLSGGDRIVNSFFFQFLLTRQSKLCIANVIIICRIYIVPMLNIAKYDASCPLLLINSYIFIFLFMTVT